MIRSPHLISIPISHYCEKVRWALKRLGLSYSEEFHVPMVHWLVNWRKGGGRTVPVLMTEDGVFRDSTDILHYLDRFAPEGDALYPKEVRQQTEDLEEIFDTHLGPHTRRWGYFYLLEDTQKTLELLSAKTAPAERRWLALCFPAVRLAMKKALHITPASAHRSLEKMKSVFEQVNELLADGRPYLTGDRFSAADLTFATLAAPAISPAEYSIPLPSPEELPAEMAAEIEYFRKTPAGVHGLKMFREEYRFGQRDKMKDGW